MQIYFKVIKKIEESSNKNNFLFAMAMIKVNRHFPEHRKKQLCVKLWKKAVHSSNHL